MTYKGVDLNDIVYIILNCLEHISEKHYYGVTMLTDVLRGANSKKIISSGLNNIAEYGKLKNISREDLILIIEWLIENYFILKTKHPTYPVLHPTYDGTHYSETMTNGKLNKLYDALMK